VINPFRELIKNESKLKLKKEDKWYDLIIKTCKEDSATHKFTYTAVDQHINELSKNGFNVTLDSSINNNMGTLIDLAKTIMTDTEWEIDEENSDICEQTVEEPLVRLYVKDHFYGRFSIGSGENSKIATGKNILEEHNRTEKGIYEINWTTNFPKKGDIVYAFYSCCSGKPKRF
jgi:hypothetical protein